VVSVACIAAACNIGASVPLPFAPVNISGPTISSSGNLAAPIPGDTLSVQPGTWLWSPAFNYQWNYSNAATISGAVGSSYTVQQNDVGSIGIYCQVTGSNALGSTFANSNSTGGILGGLPVNVSPPNISSSGNISSPVPGDGLGCDPGTWENVTDYSFQWYYSNGSAIDGATGSGYGVQLSDVGSGGIYCQVTGSNADGSGMADSGATGTVQPPPPSPPVNTSPPTISSTGSLSDPVPGDTLSVDNGTWTGWTGSAISYSYQWAYLFGEIISGSSTSNSYTLQGSDVGNQIYCQVTGSSVVGNSEADSNATEGPVEDP
jgi:hypothetical protein